MKAQISSQKKYPLWKCRFPEEKKKKKKSQVILQEV